LLFRYRLTPETFGYTLVVYTSYEAPRYAVFSSLTLVPPS